MHEAEVRFFPILCFSGVVGDDHARNQVHGKMERTRRVIQRHRKNMMETSQFSFHLFLGAKTNEIVVKIDEWVRPG